MKKIILGLIFLITLSFSNSFNYNFQSPISKVSIDNSSLIIFAKCDKVIHDPYQVKCYSYKNKAPLFNMYYLDSNVTKTYKKRLSFKEDKRIPDEYQNSLKCYKKSGLDRGHLAPDAAFDYNLTILKTTYLTSNITPEYPRVNRYFIAKIEKLVRNIAAKNNIIVITGAKYSKNYLKNNKNCPNIPEYIYKLIYIKYKNNYKFIKGYVFKNIKNITKNDIKYINNHISLIKLEKDLNIRIINYKPKSQKIFR